MYHIFKLEPLVWQKRIGEWQPSVVVCIGRRFGYGDTFCPLVENSPWTSILHEVYTAPRKKNTLILFDLDSVDFVYFRLNSLNVLSVSPVNWGLGFVVLT